MEIVNFVPINYLFLNTPNSGQKLTPNEENKLLVIKVIKSLGDKVGQGLCYR